MRRAHTMIVGGGSVVYSAPTGLVDAWKHSETTSRRIAAICTGAFILGEAGLLDGRRVTTHCMHARDLQNCFPKCLVDADRIFINDGPT